MIRNIALRMLSAPTNTEPPAAAPIDNKPDIPGSVDRKPYHVGAAGLIVVVEPYGAMMYEHAVRTRDWSLWGR